MAAAASVTGSVDAGGLNASGTGGVEMAKALSSMQIRNEQFRQLYEQLKREYSTLADAYADCQRTLEKSTDENRQMQEKFKNLLDKLQMENRKKQTQIEEMKSQLLDNTKIDQIRDRLSAEIEGPYKSALSQLDNQLEQVKTELNKVRYELNARVKEHASELSQRDQITSEIQLKNEREMTALRKERDLLQAHLREEHRRDSNIEQTRIREITQLKGKIQQLIDETTEAREAKLHAEQMAQSIQREQLKERSETKTNHSLLENERDSLRHQLSSTHQELSSISEQLSSVTRQLHERDLRLAQINSEQGDIEHRFKVEVANHKIDLAKLQGEHLERQEQLNIYIEELREKISVLTSDKAKLQVTLQEKEHLLLTSVQAVREEEWKKITEITNEKLDLESQVNILTKTIDDRQQRSDLERDRLLEQMKTFERTRDDLIKDNGHLTLTLQQINDSKNELEREQERSRDLYRKCSKLESQLASTHGIEQELTDINMKLKHELSQLMNECHLSKQEVQQMNVQCASAIDNARSAFYNEREEMRTRINQLVQQVKQQKLKIVEMQRERKEHRTRLENYSQRLIEKTQLVEAKLSEIKEKEQSLQNVVSVQTHNRLKRQLTQLLRKHAQFQALLYPNTTTNQVEIPSNDQYDLNSMITRLDRLSNEQRNQLDEYIPKKDISPVHTDRTVKESSTTAFKPIHVDSSKKDHFNQLMKKTIASHDDESDTEEEQFR